MKQSSTHATGRDCISFRPRWNWLVVTVLAWMQASAMADVIPPQAEAAAKRLGDNPRSFDRVDNFCQEKKPGAACTIGGSHFSGGGDGVCENRINTSTNTIDLFCIRTADIYLDRGLPDGGFVADSSLCGPSDADAASRGERPWSCQPLTPMPADRFCRSKSEGAACTVTLHYQGKNEQHEGICKSITEQQGFYYMGRRIATRVVIRCEPAEAAAQRTWSDVTWWQKLLQ